MDARLVLEILLLKTASFKKKESPAQIELSSVRLAKPKQLKERLQAQAGTPWVRFLMSEDPCCRDPGRHPKSVCDQYRLAMRGQTVEVCLVTLRHAVLGRDF
jgi:hypothetical protein